MRPNRYVLVTPCPLPFTLVTPGVADSHHGNLPCFVVGANFNLQGGD